jgi:hypothetical protein
MPIEVIDIIKQKNLADFPLIEDTDLLGGLQVVEDVAARDAIPVSRRKIGMFVSTAATGQLWRYVAAPNTWIEFTGGGGGSADRVIDTLVTDVNTTVGMPVSLHTTGNLVAADAADLVPVYGLSSVAASIGDPVTVVTSGVCEYAPSGLTVGARLFLGVGGGVTETPPGVALPSQKIVSLGVARTASSILVRVELIAHT